MKAKLFLLILTVSIIFTGCHKDDPIPKDPDPQMTVLVYMLANNNLASYAKGNIKDIISVSQTKNINYGNMIVFKAGLTENPQLVQIKENDLGEVEEVVVKEYEADNTADPDLLNEVIGDVKQKFPTSNYGLVLWSHGTSWLPSNYKQVKAFGQDGSNWIEIDELAKGIPDNAFHFIMFDACYMVNTECAYELKNKTKYILGSTTETMARGWPYEEIIPYFFATPEPDVLKVADLFYTYYNEERYKEDERYETNENSFRSGVARSATVTVIATAGLDNLFSVTKSILADKTMEQVYALDKSQMQRMDYLPSSPGYLYDMDDFIKQLATDEQYTKFQSALSAVVAYEGHTPTAYFASGGTKTINNSCGLTVYSPLSSYPETNKWYLSRIAWSNVYPTSN